jgi:hypothetical protein
METIRMESQVQHNPHIAQGTSPNINSGTVTTEATNSISNATPELLATALVTKVKSLRSEITDRQTQVAAVIHLLQSALDEIADEQPKTQVRAKTLEPRKRRTRVSDPEGKIKQALAANPDLTLEQLCTTIYPNLESLPTLKGHLSKLKISVRDGRLQQESTNGST